MKKNWRCIGLLVFWGVPIEYLSLLLDYHYHNLILTFVYLLCSIAVGFYCKLYLRLWPLMAVDGLRLIASGLLTWCDPRFWFLYQPFSPLAVAGMLALLFLIGQGTGISWAFFYRRNSSTSKLR